MSEVRYQITWLTGRKVLPRTRMVLDVATGMMSWEVERDGFVVSEAEIAAGWRDAPPDDRMAVIIDGERRLMCPDDAFEMLVRPRPKPARPTIRQAIASMFRRAA